MFDTGIQKLWQKKHFWKIIFSGYPPTGKDNRCLWSVREREGKRERDGEWKKSTQFGEESINGPSNRGRVGLMLKLDERLWPSMTFEVILIKMKYLRIHNIGIHINFY